MALDVWYQSDIQNALSAAEHAGGAALGAASNDRDPFVAGYEAGYRSALVTVALAFGLVPTTLDPQTLPKRYAHGLCQPLKAREGMVESSLRPRSISAKVRSRRDACCESWEEV